MTPNMWKMRREAREKLEPQARQIQALENIADTLVQIQDELTQLRVQATNIASKR
jgi:hypothetical protein